MKFAFLVTKSPLTHQNILTTISVIEASVEKGHECLLYLYIDGPLSANKYMNTPGEINIAEKLSELAKKGVKIYACGECAKFRGIKKEMLTEGVLRTGIASLY